MGPETVNRLKDSEIHGDFVGRDKITTIIMFQESEREFVVTHNANIKPVAYFTGRETELQELRQRIEEGRKSVLVSGMGGIGKTHICRKLFEEYLNKHTADENGLFRHIGYIEYSGDMSSSLQNCLKFKQQESPEQNREAAWRELEYLASDGKLLLFVDNVDKTIGADPGLQRLKGIPGAVVLTSRQVSISDEFEPYRIGFLGMEQCKEIYGKIRFEGSDRKVDPEEVEDLEYVIGSLAGRHTITVELLAHLAWTKHWSVKKLREELEQKGFRLTFHKDGEFVNIQESYEKLYDLSELTEAEQNILEAFSVFPYIPLAAETCNEWLLADAGVSEDDDILMGLYQKGWLQFDMDQEGFALHPVFAQFIYEKYEPSVEVHSGLIKECQTSLRMFKSESIKEHQNLILFAKNIAKKVKMKKNLERAEFISELAYHLCLMLKDKEAESLYKEALEIYLDVAKEDYSNIVIGYNNLASVYVSLEKYGKAKDLYKKSLEICKRMFGEDHLDTIKIYDRLGMVYLDQEEYAKAEELIEKCIRIKERKLGEDHFEVAVSYHNLAEVYIKLEKYEKAKVLYEKSISIFEMVVGKKHLHTATAYNNLARMYRIFKEYEKAEELCRKSLYIRESIFGENHPDTANSYNELACLYLDQREYGKAEELLMKNLHINKSVLGESHPGTARSYNNLATVCLDQGNYEKAEEFYRKSLYIRECVLGRNHPDTVKSYSNLACLFIRQGEYQEALEFCITAYKINVSMLGFNHSHTQHTYEDIKLVYAEWDPEGNFEQWLEEKMKE